MTSNIEAVVNRLAAVALLFAVAAGVAVFAILPLVEAYEASGQEIARLRDQLARLTSAARALPAAEAENKASASRRDAQKLEYRAENSNVAAAQLQQAMSELVRAKGGQMRLARVMDKSKAADAERIAIAFTFAISNDGLAALLYEIEGLRPPVFVSDLAVRLNRTLDGEKSGQPANAGGPFRDEPILDVGLEASAFFTSAKSQ